MGHYSSKMKNSCCCLERNREREQEMWMCTLLKHRENSDAEPMDTDGADKSAFVSTNRIFNEQN
jgi:hypothetical protein